MEHFGAINLQIFMSDVFLMGILRVKLKRLLNNENDIIFFKIRFKSMLHYSRLSLVESHKILLLTLMSHCRVPMIINQ